MDLVCASVVLVYGPVRLKSIFGKAINLTNILRNLTAELSSNRCRWIKHIHRIVKTQINETNYKLSS